MKKIITFFVLVFTSCASNNKVLYIGTNAEYPPFEFIENGKIVGFDIELVQEISKIIGRDIKIENMAFDGLIPALQTKKIDLIIAGMAATEDRKKSVDFSDLYYKTENQRLIVQKVNNTISNIESLAGRKAGVIIGFTSDTYLTEKPEIELSRFNGAGEAILALKAGKIDALMLDADPSKNYLSQNKDLKDFVVEGTNEEYAMALRKEDRELLDAVNKALETLRANGKYEELYLKYFTAQ